MGATLRRAQAALAHRQISALPNGGQKQGLVLSTVSLLPWRLRWQ
jgi:hypothetical protein